MMKELTFKIPNDKVSFLKDLMKQLGFEISSEETEISEFDKKEVRNRIKKSNENPEIIQDWDAVQDSFKLD